MAAFISMPDSRYCIVRQNLSICFLNLLILIKRNSTAAQLSSIV